MNTYVNNVGHARLHAYLDQYIRCSSRYLWKTKPTRSNSCIRLFWTSTSISAFTMKPSGFLPNEHKIMPGSNYTLLSTKKNNSNNSRDTILAVFFVLCLVRLFPWCWLVSHHFCHGRNNQLAGQNVVLKIVVILLSSLCTSTCCDLW